VGDIINLSYTSTGANTFDFGLVIPANTTVKTILNGGPPVSITPTGTGPYTYTMDDIALQDQDVYVIQVTVTSCDVDSILFRYITQA
jgi:hypothetical protein